MIEKYEVGKPFPHQEYKQFKGAVIMLNESSFDIVIVFPNISKKELKEFKKQKFKYGFVNIESIPFFMLLFRGIFELDTSLNIKSMRVPEQKTKWLEKEANTVTFFLVDSSTFILKGMRLCGLDFEMMQEIKNTCKTQDEKYKSKADVDQIISQVLNRYTIEKLISLIPNKYEFNKNSAK